MLRVLEKPDYLPLQISDVRDYLQIIGHDDDRQIMNAIESAVSMVDFRLGFALMPQKWRYTYTAKSGRVCLPGAPYIDGGCVYNHIPKGASNRVETAITCIRETESMSGDIEALEPVAGWAAIEPNTLAYFDYVIGYEYVPVTLDADGNPSGGKRLIPRDLQQGLLMLISQLYDDRANTPMIPAVIKEYQRNIYG